MIDALTAAASSMQVDMERMAALSRNLANISTPGFKREIIRAQQLQGATLGAGQTPPSDGQIGALAQATTHRDLRAGPLRDTGHVLDLALDGPGYFELRTASGITLTRAGNFKIDPLGRLVSQSGDPVQGSGGDIVLSTAQPRVDAQGRVLDGDRLVAQLKLLEPASSDDLEFVGSGQYKLREGANPLLPASERLGVRQGYLEMPNVESAQEMVRLLETVRHFEAAQKVIQGYDEMMDRALKKLGEF